MRSLGIWTYGDWSELGRKERVHWLAFYLLEKDIEAYAYHADELQKIGFSLQDWRQASESERDMKIKQTRNS